ncbi:MAG: hypothetical protein ACRBBN_20435 [Methyloligellaceae bacterium]
MLDHQTAVLEPAFSEEIVRMYLPKEVNEAVKGRTLEQDAIGSTGFL